MSESAAVVEAPVATGGGIVSRHPNASVALGSGAGLGPLVVWCVGFTGAVVPAEVGAALGGVLASVFLLIGRRGIRGVMLAIWRGSES
jgi:hypothetical protein